jgi:lipid II:glycine glycyltransferase (peptidoglycan interpeptide bridge formation enzyme)
MIREVTEEEKKIFNEATIHPLQSWEWGEFRKAHGNSVSRYAIFDGEKISQPFQIVWSHVPKTPFNIGTVIRGVRPTEEMLRFLKNVSKEKNAIFVKLEPYILKDDRIEKILKNGGAVSGKTFFTPTSFWIDLTLSEEDLLKSFHSKTRYNIRLAERKGVTVTEDNSDKAFEKYLKLFFDTTKRQGYYMHSENYHRLMWKTLHTDMLREGKDPIARLLTARYKKKIVTTWIVFVWHDFLYYPYGGSDETYRSIMPNNLIMWEAVRYGKKLGLSTFDLWGREEGKGFTKFKEGYNPKVIEFIGTWDLPTSPLYKPYTYAEKMRWEFLRAKAKFKTA